MPEKYIVVFKKSASKEVVDKVAAQVDGNGGKVENKFDSIVMKGFAAEIPDQYLLALQSSLNADDNQIAYIEPDSIVTTQAA